MKTVGLPKGLLYYRYETLWKSFFKALNVPVMVSEESNLLLLEKGKKKSIDEACLSLKLFIGHVESLKNKCDYVLVPRIYSLEKDEQVCTNFNCLYDLIKNVYPELNILNYNIDVKHHKSEKKAFIAMGNTLGFSKLKSKKAYAFAKSQEKIEKEKKEQNQNIKLKTNKKKILILGHPYNTKDCLIGKSITDFLSNYPVEIIYSDIFNEKLVNKYAKKISPKVHWTMNKELLASFMYYKDKVDGVIVISAFPCGPDSLTNEMILRKKANAKVLLLTFEELNSNIALLTRLESFLDMLKGGIHL